MRRSANFIRLRRVAEGAGLQWRPLHTKVCRSTDRAGRREQRPLRGCALPFICADFLSPSVTRFACATSLVRGRNRRAAVTQYRGKRLQTNFGWILRGFFSRDKAQMRRRMPIRRAAVTQYRGKKTAKSGDVVEFKVVYTYCVPLLNPLFYKGVQNTAGPEDFLEILQ